MSSELTDLEKAEAAEKASPDEAPVEVTAERSLEPGAAVAAAVAIESGMRVLEVGGTAAAAAHVALSGAEVELTEGDAQPLPYDDDSFDRVLTVFGTMFAAEHDAAANELVRVCKPGGEIVMANWSPDGFAGRLSAIARNGSADGADAATEWGTHGHVRRRLGGQLVLAIEPASVDLCAESADALLAEMEEGFAPLAAAKAELEPQRYDELRTQAHALIEELDDGEGETRVASAYVVVIGHKPVAM